VSAIENEVLVRRMIAALQARDVAALGEALTDDVSEIWVLLEDPYALDAFMA
jgi:hypothetical protein